MYTLGDNWNSLFRIVWDGLLKNPDDELLLEVKEVLMQYSEERTKGFGDYSITSETITNLTFK